MMRAYRIAAAAALVALGGTAQAARLTDFSGLFVFGDSLVDSGNARDGSAALGLPNPTPTVAGYVDGRYSNGFNFADRLAQGINGQAATPFSQRGTNFAVGGATAAGAAGAARSNFLSQVGTLQSTMQPIAGDALVLITFGGNDIRLQAGRPGMIDFSASLTAFSDGLGQLIDAGARNIVVTGLPDIGKVPEALGAGLIDPSIPALASERSRYLNNQLAAISGNAAKGSGASITFFSLLGFQQNATAAPQLYGLTTPLNTTMPCRSVPGAVTNGCGGFLYFDSVHPVQQVHAAIAGSIERQLLTGAVPEPSVWAMMIAGFGMIGGLLRRARRRAAPRLLPA